MNTQINTLCKAKPSRMQCSTLFGCYLGLAKLCKTLCWQRGIDSLSCFAAESHKTLAASSCDLIQKAKDLNAVQRQLTDTQEGLSALSHAVDKHQQQAVLSKQTIQGMLQVQDELQAALNASESSLSRAHEEQREGQAAHEQLSAENRSSQQAAADLSQEVAQLQAQLHQSHASCEQLQSTLLEAHEATAAVTNAKGEVQQALEQAQADQLKTQAELSAETCIKAELERACCDARETASDFRRAHVDVEQRLEASAAALQETRTQLSASQMRLGQSEEELHSVQDEHNQTCIQLASAQDHLGSVQAQLNHATGLNAHLTAEHKEAQSAMDDLAQASSELQIVLTESQSQLSLRRAELAESDETVLDLREALAAAEQAAMEAAAKYNQTMSHTLAQVDQLNSELRASAESADEASRRHTDTALQLTELADTLAATQQSVTRAECEARAHESGAIQLRTQLNHVSESFRGAEEEVQELHEALRVAEEEAQEARGDAAAHEDAAADFLEELDQARADKSALEAQLQDSKVTFYDAKIVRYYPAEEKWPLNAIRTHRGLKRNPHQSKL